MPRYYFDIRENDEVAVDEVGLDLPGLHAAELEAVASLSDLIREMPADAERHAISIEVRQDSAVLAKAALTVAVDRLN